MLCNCPGPHTCESKGMIDITSFSSTTPAEHPGVAFYRRDNEELRKFLEAERIENNRLRDVVSDLREAVGIALGVFMTPIGNGETGDKEIAAITARIRLLVDRSIPIAKEAK